MRVYLTNHAVQRFTERVRPTLDFLEAATELRRLAENYGALIDRPPWLEPASMDGVDRWLEVSPGVVLALRNPAHRGHLPLVLTVLCRGHISGAKRARRNAGRAAHSPARARTFAERRTPRRAERDWRAELD